MKTYKKSKKNLGNVCIPDLQSEKITRMFHYLTKRPPAMAKQRPIRSRVSHKQEMKRVNSISPRVAQHVLCIAKRYKLKIMEVYAPTTSYSDKNINSLYKDVDDSLGKPNKSIIR